MQNNDNKQCMTCNKYRWSRYGKETVIGKCITCFKIILKTPLPCPTCKKKKIILMAYVILMKL